MNTMHIRWMIRRDLPAVLRIEQDCFPANQWSEDDFIRCLRNRSCIGMVTEDSDGEAVRILRDFYETCEGDAYQMVYRCSTAPIAIQPANRCAVWFE